MMQFLTGTNRMVIPHPPYSPDPAYCDFVLFLKMKLKLKGHHFNTTDTESQAVSDSLQDKGFRSAFET